jgi:hypothetical protein
MSALLLVAFYLQEDSLPLLRELASREMPSGLGSLAAEVGSLLEQEGFVYLE